jgi:hypothetical protein
VKLTQIHEFPISYVQGREFILGLAVSEGEILPLAGQTGQTRHWLTPAKIQRVLEYPKVLKVRTYTDTGYQVTVRLLGSNTELHLQLVPADWEALRLQPDGTNIIRVLHPLLQVRWAVSVMQPSTG